MLENNERMLMKREIVFLQDMKRHLNNPKDPRTSIIEEHISLLEEAMDEKNIEQKKNVYEN